MLQGGSFSADIGTDQQAGQPLFHAYGDDYLQLGNTRYKHGICVHNKEIIAPWGPQRLRDLTVDHLSFLHTTTPELLVLGTGRLTAFPCPEVMELLADLHIGFECMDSKVAARTYNFLLSEGRTVSTAMLPPHARN